MRGEGQIKRCMDDVYDGVTSCNVLTEMLVNEESEHAYTFEEEEQEELLFHVFRRLAVGGSCCQCEEKVTPYVETARALYKDLVKVQKDPATGKIEPASLAFEITSLDGEAASLFSKPESPHNFAYVVVDPIDKTVVFWSFSFVPFW